MLTAKVFKNGRSQAVRLPKSCRFRTKEVIVTRIDDMVVLFPKSKGWDLMEKSLGRFTSDFMETRDQGGPAEEREPF